MKQVSFPALVTMCVLLHLVSQGQTPHPNDSARTNINSVRAASNDSSRSNKNGVRAASNDSARFGYTHHAMAASNDSARYEPGKHDENVVKNSSLSQAIENGTIYLSHSPHHNTLHEYTLLVATRDYCQKALAQMVTDKTVDEKRSKELEKELSKSKTELSSAKFKGLKTETGMYDVFTKQVHERFKN